MASTVLVTGASGGAGIAAARELAQAGFDVVGADTHPLPLGLRSRFLRAFHALDGRSEERLAQTLLETTERVRPDALLALGTPASAAVSLDHQRFARLTAVNLPGPDAFAAAYDKTRCAADCQAVGIPVPHCHSAEDARARLGLAPGTRLVVKPAFDAGAATGIRYVQDTGELDEALRACTASHGRALVQDYVPGGPEAMKTAVLLFAPDGTLAAWFTTHKLREWPATGGLTAISRSSDEYALVEAVLPLFQLWRWRGPAEVEFKLDPCDGRHKLIEVNPRFPAYLRFPHHCGLDLATMAVRLALGADLAPAERTPAYRVGVTYVNPGLALRAACADLRSGATRRLLRTLRGTGSAARDVLALLADPPAFVGTVLREASGRAAAASGSLDWLARNQGGGGSRAGQLERPRPASSPAR